MIRQISSLRYSSVSSGLNGHDIRCGDQNATLFFYCIAIYRLPQNPAPVVVPIAPSLAATIDQTINPADALAFKSLIL